MTVMILILINKYVITYNKQLQPLHPLTQVRAYMYILYETTALEYICVCVCVCVCVCMYVCMYVYMYVYV